MSRYLWLSASLVVFAGAVAALPAEPARDARETKPPGGKPTPLEAEELRDAARRTYEAVSGAFRIGFQTADDLCIWSQKWMEAERVASKTPEEDRQAVRSHLARLQGLGEARVKWRFDIARVAYHLTEAEALLASLDPKYRDFNKRVIEDRRRLQGTWRAQAETINGKPVQELTRKKITVQGRVVDDESRSGGFWGILSLDPTRSPKTFKYAAFNDDYFPERHGTYRLESDVWTITLPGEEVITLTRTKPEVDDNSGTTEPKATEALSAGPAGETPGTKPPEKVLPVPRTDDFDVTGRGDAPQWQKARWEPLALRTAGGHAYPTRVKTLYSATGLYVLMDAADGVITATMKEDFLDLWNEDVFEFFLWTDERQPVYFEYEISPLGFELPILIPNFDGKFLGWRPWHYEGPRKTRKATSVVGGPKQAGAKISGWKAEVFVPFELLAPLGNVPPKPGTRWRANFYRIDYDDGKTTQWDWARVGATFHEFRKFGTLVFEP